MPRATWSGHLRLSLVSCPIYLAPATTESTRIRLHQLNPETGNRISMKTVDSVTGEPVERSQIIKGYEYDKGQYVALGKEELDEIAIESSKVLDLTTFVDQSAVNPLYLADPYHIYPGDKSGIEAFRVITQAMVNKKRAAIGRVVLSSREHPVMVEPFDQGLLMSILRTAEEVRAADYHLPKDELNPELIEMAEAIMAKLKGEWDPAAFHDRYQDALREVVNRKVEGLPAAAHEAATAPSNVVDLMAALKNSLAGAERPADRGSKTVRKAPGKAPGKAKDQRQGSMLLPIKGSGAGEKKEPAAQPGKTTRRKKA